MKKYLAFDCFNTLIDNFDRDGDTWGLNCVEEIPVKQGIFKSTLEFKNEYKKKKKNWFINFKELDLLNRLISVLGSKNYEIASYMVDLYKKRCYKYLRLAPGTKEMLLRVQETNRLCIVSNYFLKNMLNSILEYFDILSIFDFVISSADFGYRKPSHLIYEKVIQVFNNDKKLSEITFIGDNQVNDVLEPTKLGMNGIYFYRTYERPNMQKPNNSIQYITKWDEFMTNNNI